MNSSFFNLSRRRVWVLSSIAAVILGIVALSYLISSESLRRYMEDRINGHLEGYTVHIGKEVFENRWTHVFNHKKWDLLK